MTLSHSKLTLENFYCVCVCVGWNQRKMQLKLLPRRGKIFEDAEVMLVEISNEHTICPSECDSGD